jgi:hypothetical protein
MMRTWLVPAVPRLLLVLPLTWLLGCQTQVKEAAEGPWIAVQSGGTLTLNRPIPVPQDRARVFFRDGDLQPTGANQGPSCGLEIRTIPRSGPHVIPAGSFTIARVQTLWTQVAHRDPGREPAGHPGAARLQLAAATDGGGTPLIQEGYHLWLEGGPDSDVMRLTCLGMLDDMWRARPPTLDEIRDALGDVATLDLAPSPPPKRI